MKLQDPQKAFPPFDVAAGMAQVLLRQGYIEIKAVEPVKPILPLTWWVVSGAIEGDYQHPPTIRHKCGTCMTYPGEASSQVGTAHKSVKVFHCGQKGLMCPPDVAAQYEKAFAAWYARSGAARKAAKEKAARKPATPGFDPLNPNHVSPMAHVRAHGLKTHQELISLATEARNGK